MGLRCVLIRLRRGRINTSLDSGERNRLVQVVHPSVLVERGYHDRQVLARHDDLYVDGRDLGRRGRVLCIRGAEGPGQ